MSMTPDELRQSYLDFFAQRGHEIVPSSSLVPENDPTTLFTGSGMQPLLPYFLGEPHPKGTRVVNSQKCFRSQDIEEVGDNRHTTFFEMLGNWSFGDYFKQEQLEWFFEFLTDVLGLDPNKLYVTVYGGNAELGIPKDEKAIQIWEKLFAEAGVEGQRVFEYQKENWWSRVGAPENMPVGEPGGPDSEVFYDFGAELKTHENSEFADEECHINCDCGRYLEIGNSVFMTYQRTQQGYEELKNKNIDFGGGLERLLAAQQADPDVFNTPLFRPIIEKLEKLSGRGYETDQDATQAMRIISDHVKAAVMLAADGVYPDNKEQGYFSRRLLRRAIRYGQQIEIFDNFLGDLVGIVGEIYAQQYPEVLAKKDEIERIFTQEEEKFNQTLSKGLAEFHKEVGEKLLAASAFKLYETYGFPVEMSIEEAEKNGLKIEDDILDNFAKLKDEHAAASRESSQGKFKGGLADKSDATVQYHTATHLLHAALRKILGEEVEQKGSNITPDRLRFDFSFSRELTNAEKTQVAEQVNQWIAAELPVTMQQMKKDEALKSGAIAFFLEKYPDEVSVYTIGNDSENDWVSKEFCGGPHVENTGEIQPIEIFKEKSSGAGVRRIYARFK